jgi:elongation factor Ts
MQRSKGLRTKETRHGIIVSRVGRDGSYGVMLELNCESDFVAKTALFRVMANHILDLCEDKMFLSREDLLEDSGVKSFIKEAILEFKEIITIGRTVRFDVND